MTRLVTWTAIGGLATAAICLPLASVLDRSDGTPKGWEQGWNMDNLPWPGDHDMGVSDGPAVSRDFAWDGMDHVEFDVPGTLHFQSAPQWHLRVRGSARTLDRLSVQNGRIGAPTNWLRFTAPVGPVDVELEGPDLREVALNGAGTLVIEQLKQHALTVVLRGSGVARAAGEVDDLKLSLMGSGSASFEHLIARTADIFVAGSARADIAPLDSADAVIAGSGMVRLHTHPKHLTSRVMGSGEVVEVSDDDLHAMLMVVPTRG